MLSLRNRFGVAGIVSVMALALALVAGGAYAASGDGATASAKNRKGGGNVNKLIKREARKFSKVFSQRFSKRFAVPGPIGPQGFPGLPGAPGEDGDDGDDGSNGSNGSNGKSAEVSEVACGGLGGAEVKVEGAAEGVEVCNGEEGSPWTAGGVLPQGETLTGTWGGNLPGAGSNFVPISYGIPLENVPTTVIVKPSEDKSGEGCPKPEDWANSGIPEAAEGTLCLYQGEGPGAGVEPGEPEALIFNHVQANGGQTINVSCSGPCAWEGLWAVTAG